MGGAFFTLINSLSIGPYQEFLTSLGVKPFLSVVEKFSSGLMGIRMGRSPRECDYCATVRVRTCFTGAKAFEPHLQEGDPMRANDEQHLSDLDGVGRGFVRSLAAPGWPYGT
jgi:hypothetical protein